MKIVAKQLTVAEAAVEYGISRRHLHRLLARYRQGGLDALEPRSRRPITNPTATADTTRERIIQLRRQLTAQGLDAGPVTIGWHLEQEGLRAPSTSTIRRKALPSTAREAHYRLRYDHVGDNGKMSLRRAGRMHHLGIGATHRGKRVLALIDETTVTVIHLDTGEIIATNTIDPAHSYWRNTKKVPGR